MPLKEDRAMPQATHAFATYLRTDSETYMLIAILHSPTGGGDRDDDDIAERY